MKLIYNKPKTPTDLEYPKDIFVVYSHWIGDKLIYVGSGSVPRAFDKFQRNDLWHQAVSEAGYVDVYFSDVGDNEAAIRAHEQKLISRLCPAANRYFNPNYSMPAEQREAKRISSTLAWENRVAHPNSVAACIENCRKGREARSKKVKRSDGTVFPSLASAARDLSCSTSTITNRIHNGTSWKGFKFTYA